MYTPTASFNGLDSFTYRARDGSALSEPATVSITVKAVGYGFVNVKNLPPAAGVTFKPSSKGTLVDFEWKFTKNGSVVSSSDAQPSVTIQSPSGVITTFTPAQLRRRGHQVRVQGGHQVVGLPLAAEKRGGRDVLRHRLQREDRTAVPDHWAGFPVVFKN